MESNADYRKYRAWFTTLLVVLVGGFFVASFAYNGRFNLLTDPFSRLGASETPEGNANRSSMAVFVIDMVITAMLFICITIAFAGDRKIPFRSARVLFSALAALGASIATFPNNYFLTQHQLGAGLLVGSFWIHSILFIVDASKVSSRGYTLFLHLLLQSTVLTYAYTFFVHAPARDVVQKFAVAGLALSIELSLAALCREPAAAGDQVAKERAEEHAET